MNQPGAERVEDTYEVYALRYAGLDGGMSSDWYYRYEAYGLPDEPCPMANYFWLARSKSRTVLVDCGAAREPGLSRAMEMGSGPAELLARLGVRPEDVDHVVLTHMHFDHIGNVSLFPNATFTMAQAELDFWTGPGRRLSSVGAPVEEGEVEAVLSLAREERLHVVEQAAELFPGIRVERVGGHTPGQLIAEIGTASGKTVVASDALHFYKEMERNHLYRHFTSVEEMDNVYRLLREHAARPDTAVVAGHDPAVMALFRPVAEDCFDVSQRPVAPGRYGPDSLAAVELAGLPGQLDMREQGETS
ncbi:N-acyl homoserine lactonase family protein [Streptomyces sp. NPDC056983]|uniref:N-acyl homoserine lactonase family protein n=1 Tax=Streptomyces sp. NPDC056983 TaxID=3345987 RepID=UPI0036337AB8